jgi:hypothetical protein
VWGVCLGLAFCIGVHGSGMAARPGDYGTLLVLGRMIGFTSVQAPDRSILRHICTLRCCSTVQVTAG